MFINFSPAITNVYRRLLGLQPYIYCFSQFYRYCHIHWLEHVFEAYTRCIENSVVNVQSRTSELGAVPSSDPPL